MKKEKIGLTLASIPKFSLSKEVSFCKYYTTEVGFFQVQNFEGSFLFMARNVMKDIEYGRKMINPRYDMKSDEIISILNMSSDTVNAIFSAFEFGYAQATKAAKAEMRRS